MDPDYGKDRCLVCGARLGERLRHLERTKWDHDPSCVTQTDPLSSCSCAAAMAGQHDGITAETRYERSLRELGLSAEGAAA